MHGFPLFCNVSRGCFFLAFAGLGLSGPISRHDICLYATVGPTEREIPTRNREINDGGILPTGKRETNDLGNDRLW